MKFSIMRASSFHPKKKSRAECCHTQRDLFDHSVLSHDVAGTPSLCVMHAESARCMMLERQREQKTYPQRWREYNLSQTREKAYFLELLHRLCSLIEEPEKPKGKGRPSARLSDLVFAACVKVYGCMSGRRNQSDLDDALRRGHLSRPVRYNTLFKYLELESLTPILRQLITASALPLKEIEQDFAVDSSGFSTNRFVRWYGVKYGGVEDWHDWIKLHAMVGVSTHVITSVEISERNAHDGPFFAPLVTDTARNFHLREVSGDKAYTSRANLRLVKDLGAEPYVAFKSNSRGDTNCAVWNRVYHTYCMNREDYMRRYHKRSNAESAFSMIKARFGERVRSKTRTAQVNEVLCKVLCHNLCVLVQSIYELGLDVEFIGINDVCLQNEGEA
jgi:transposase